MRTITIGKTPYNLESRVEKGCHVTPKKFNLERSDWFWKYWHDIRKEEDIFSKRNQGGGSVIVWVWFSWIGKSQICLIELRMNAENSQLLKDDICEIVSIIGGINLVFLQNKGPIHMANANKSLFNKKKLTFYLGLRCRLTLIR